MALPEAVVAASGIARFAIYAEAVVSKRATAFLRIFPATLEFYTNVLRMKPHLTTCKQGLGHEWKSAN